MVSDPVLGLKSSRQWTFWVFTDVHLTNKDISSWSIRRWTAVSVGLVKSRKNFKCSQSTISSSLMAISPRWSQGGPLLFFFGQASKTHVKITQGVTSSFSSVINQLLNSVWEFLANSSWLYFSLGQICLHIQHTRSLLFVRHLPWFLVLWSALGRGSMVGASLSDWLCSKYLTISHSKLQAKTIAALNGHVRSASTHSWVSCTGFSSPVYKIYLVYDWSKILLTLLLWT